MDSSGQKGLVSSRWSMLSHAGYRSTSSTAEISAPPITSWKEIRFKSSVKGQMGSQMTANTNTRTHKEQNLST